MDSEMDVNVKVEVVMEEVDVNRESGGETTSSKIRKRNPKGQGRKKLDIETTRARYRLYAQRRKERMGEEQFKKMISERKKERKAKMTEEEKEQARLRRKPLTEEQRRKKAEDEFARKVRRRLEQGLPPPVPRGPRPKGPVHVTEEEKQRRKEKYKFKAMVKRMERTEEQKEADRIRDNFARHAKLARMTPEEQAEARKKWVKKEQDRLAKLTPEKKAIHRERMTIAHRKMRQKWKEQFPEKYERHMQLMKESVQRQRERETPEQRQKRLLGYRINQKKTRLRKQLEGEGASAEEIERRVNALVEEMKSGPLPPPSPHTPRPRKNKKFSCDNSESSNSLPPTSFPALPSYQSTHFLQQPQTFQNEFGLGRTSLPFSTTSTSTWGNSFPNDFGGCNQNQTSFSSTVSVASPLCSDPVENDDFDDMPLSPSSSAMPDLESEMEWKTSPSLPPPPIEINNQPSAKAPLKRRPGRPPKIRVTVNTRSAASCTSVTSETTGLLSSGSVYKPSASETWHSPSDRRVAGVQTLPATVLPPSSETTAPNFSSQMPSSKSSSSSAPCTSSNAIKMDLSTSTSPDDILTPEMCDECGATFKSKMSLRIHKSEAHTEELTADLTCPKCSILCATKQDLWEHFVKSHNAIGTSINGEDCQEMSGTKKYEVIEQPKKPISVGIFPPRPKKRYHDGELHPCSECGKCFRQKATLDDHIRRTHEGKGYHCDLCRSDCQSLTKLWRHKVERHGMSDLPPPEGIQTSSCKYCGELVIRSYATHVKKKHPECLEEFLNSDEFKMRPKRVRIRHKRVGGIVKKPSIRRKIPKELQIQVKCLICGEVMPKSELKKHMRAKHYIPCAECGKLCESLPELNKHYRHSHVFKNIDKELEAKNYIKFIHPVTKAAVCLVCDTSLPLSDEIRSHFLLKHVDILEELVKMNSSGPGVECELCENVKVITESELIHHMEMAHPEISYLCPHCGLFRKTQAELEKHVDSHSRSANSNRKEKKFGSCMICKKDFVELNGVEDIVKTSTATKKKIKADLESHVERDHPESFFRCPHCPTWVYRQISLKGHLNWCLKNKIRDKCELNLPKKEKRVSNKYYMAKTLGLMKILCTICKTARCMRNMKQHLETAHKIKQDSFQCEHCPRMFSLYEYYVGHVELMHEIPLDEIVLIPKPEDLVNDDGTLKGRRGQKSNERKPPSRKRNVRKKIKRSTDSEGDDEEEKLDALNSESNDTSNQDNDKIPSPLKKTRRTRKKSSSVTLQRSSGRKSRARKSSKDKMEAEPTSKPKSKRGRKKKLDKTGTKTEARPLVNHSDVEKEKRLVIYVYPLTEEDMKPYIKQVH